eukprot:857712_1
MQRIGFSHAMTPNTDSPFKTLCTYYDNIPTPTVFTCNIPNSTYCDIHLVIKAIKQVKGVLIAVKYTLSLSYQKNQAHITLFVYKSSQDVLIYLSTLPLSAAP